MRFRIWLLAVLAGALLAACTLPRGAAIQREILAGQNDEFPQIAVYPVTRSFMPVLASWPSVGGPPSHGWVPTGTASGDIRIRPFDTVELTVWDSEENSLLTAQASRSVDIRNLRVNEAGQIFVPFVGYLRVADRTPDSARRLVEDELATIVPSAQVQLAVRPGSRGSVNLVGGTETPGSYPLPEANFTVLDLISAGGGPDGLRNPQVRLIRDGRTFVTSYESLIEQPIRNAVLRGGDRVALVEDDRFFRALGASELEQIIYFEEDEVSALDALSLMGGLNDRRANARGVLILREYPPQAVRADATGPSNTRAVFTVDLTDADGIFSAGQFRIQPGDTVMATESVITSAEAVVVLLGTVIGVTRTVAN